MSAAGMTDERLHEATLDAVAVLTSAMRGERDVITRGDVASARTLLVAYWKRALDDHERAMQRRRAA